MNSLKRTTEVVLALGLLAATTWLAGVAYGRLSNRWGAAEDLDGVVSRIEDFPRQIGPWRCVAEHELDPDVVVMLDAYGMIHRDYEHETTKQTIGLFLLIGPPGPVAVHTPEICFPSGSYKLLGERQAVNPLESEDDTFWMVDFQSTGVHGQRVRAYYGWLDPMTWSASANPRWEFAGQPCLVKLQLSTLIPRRPVPGQVDAGHQFLQSFIPQFRQHVETVPSR